jgi:hypothetical protein
VLVASLIFSKNQELARAFLRPVESAFAMLKVSFVLVESVLSCLAALRVFFQTRGDTLGILALRQQLAALKRKRPLRQLNPVERKPKTNVFSLRRFGLHHCYAWREAA